MVDDVSRRKALGYGLIRTLLLPVVGAYGVIALALFSFQSRMIYYPELPSRELLSTPAQIGLEYESVYMNTADGLRLHGWFLPARGARKVLLFCHGNAGNISHRLDSLKLFHDLGLNVLIFDYRGYGRSQGKPSEQGTYDDAEAVWNHLTQERDFAAQDIIVFGRSLGAAIAAELAARHPPGALILESGFISVPDLASDLYPWLPVRWLARFSYNTRAYLGAVSSPVLVAHSRDDEIIPFKHGEKLFTIANELKRFLELRGGHNDGFYVSQTIYVKGLSDFLKEINNTRR